VTPDLCQRITDYLTCGGLFNPESALHERVRDLLIECRTELVARAVAEKAPAPRSQLHNPWQQAIINQLVCNFILTKENEDNPTKALADLMAWERKITLDPEVSSAAAELIERGRAEKAPEDINLLAAFNTKLCLNELIKSAADRGYDHVPIPVIRDILSENEKWIVGAEKAAPVAPPLVGFDKFLELLREFHDIQNKGISYIGAAARFYNAALAGVAQEAAPPRVPTEYVPPTEAAMKWARRQLNWFGGFTNFEEQVQALAEAFDELAAPSPLNADEIVEACAKVLDASEFHPRECLAGVDGYNCPTSRAKTAIRALKGRFTLAAPQVREETKP